MFEKIIAGSFSPLCLMLLYKVSNVHSVTCKQDTTEDVYLLVQIHDTYLICQWSNAFRGPRILEEYFPVDHPNWDKSVYQKYIFRFELRSASIF